MEGRAGEGREGVGRGSEGVWEGGRNQLASSEDLLLLLFAAESLQRMVCLLFWEQ